MIVRSLEKGNWTSIVTDFGHNPAWRGLKHALSATIVAPDLVFPSHHLCQILKSTPPLVDNPVESFRRTNRSDDDLITSRGQAFECLVHECLHRHTELSAAVIAHVVV